MKLYREKIVVRCKTHVVPIPKTREPFVNTPLLSLGSDESGLERFWISTWNSAFGTTCVVVNEMGEHRILRPGIPHWGFYSAAMEDVDTLWLCGDLSRVVRLKISSGRFETFHTGAPPALVFQGMVFDAETGKLFVAAFPPPRTTAVSFDTRKGETARIYHDFTTAHYMRCSFANGDGTWTSVLHVPGEALVRWDPRRENIDVTVLSSRIDPHAAAGTTQRLLRWQGRVYFPHRGWFDTRSMKCVDGPRPEKELTWFALRGETAFGVEWKKGTISVGAWDFASGHVRDVCDIQDSQVHNVNLSASGKVIAVNTYGVFHRFDAESGALEMCKVLPTDGVGVVDCLCRIDKERLLGTPFITQRFWEVNLRTGDGVDCGRAAPGAGEILLVWKLGGKIYMAAYTGGELMEYDPRRHPHYPENPRVVASPPHAMRPVAAATDGRHIFYACSAPYGNLGSVVTRYDTKTGLASYRVNPLPEQQIRSLYYDRASGNLLCGTTMHSDCQSCPPASDECYLACLDAETLEVRQQIAAPKGTEVANVVGEMRTGEVLCTFTGSQGLRWCSVKPGHLELPPEDKIKSFAEGVHQIVAAGRPGLFVLRLSDRVELWDMRRSQCVKTLLLGIDKRFYVYRVVVQERSVYVVTPRDVIVLEDVL